MSMPMFRDEMSTPDMGVSCDFIVVALVNFAVDAYTGCCGSILLVGMVSQSGRFVECGRGVDSVP